MWSSLHYPCVNGTVGENCDPYCLYYIVEDLSERNELSKQEPEMLENFLHYTKFVDREIFVLP